MDRKKAPADGMPTRRQSGSWPVRAVVEDGRPRQRGGIRKTIPCSMLVRTATSYIVVSRIHDISLTGAFVELDPAGLAVGDDVEVSMDIDRDGTPVEHQVSAEITRVETRGIGLRFNSYGDRAYTDLVNLLYGT